MLEYIPVKIHSLKNQRKLNMNMQLIEELSAKLREALAKSPAGDLEKNIHALLQGAFTKLALVSREEFDVQTEVLRRTREKLDALEKKLAELERSK
jgi:BMFP domain-containing protein YqiC